MFVAAPARATAKAPQRIVSLKPNITEIVYALGRGDALVGRTKYCDRPAEAASLPVVADYTRPFVERIVALAPDLVLASEENASRRSTTRLEQLGIAVALFDFSSFDATKRSIVRIAERLGVPERGRELVATMEAQLTATSRRWEKAAPRRVAIVVGVRPLIVAGRRSYLGELLPAAQLVNAAPPSRLGYPRIDLEGLIAIDPDAIVDVTMGSEGRDADAMRPWAGVAALKAVREKRTIPFDMSRLRPGPELPKALDELAQLIHGGSR